MSIARFRFYEELNDFLPPQYRRTGFEHEFHRRASIKDMIEALGVPHTEVELILVNGGSVGFSYLVQDADRISVYPMFESLDISSLLRVRQRPLRHPRFVVDGHLGRLARYLRLMGFDTLYHNDFHDPELAEISSRQDRILLTRDRGLLKRKIITHGCYIHHDRPRDQLRELFARLDLQALIRPYSRCANCNGLIVDVDKEAVAGRLAPKTRRYYQHFRQCQDCAQIYWQGSHFTRMHRLVEEMARMGCH